jgi:ABC-type transporter Mla subunit MlaD
MSGAFSYTLQWSEKIRRGLDELGVEFDDLFASVENLVEKDIFGTITNFDTMNRNMERALDILREGMEQFDAIIEKAGRATERDIDIAQRLLETFDLLDESTLQNLQNEIDDLAQSLTDAKDAAENLLRDLQMDLLRLADDQAAIELARFESEMEKLRELMEEAQTEEIRRMYAEAMRLEQEKHNQIMDNIDAESAARAGEQEQTVDDTRPRTTTEEIERVTENIVYDQRQITYVWNVPYETTEDFVRDTVVPILDQIAEGEA